jgi:hypothetical protein
MKVEVQAQDWARPQGCPNPYLEGWLVGILKYSALARVRGCSN